MYSSRRAIIDADGNIILPVQDVQEHATVPVIEEDEGQNEPQNEAPERTIQPEEIWTIIDEEISSEIESSIHEPSTSARLEQAKVVWSTVREHVYSVTGNILDESTRQYQASVLDGRVAGVNAMQSLRGSARTFWNFLRQPVWIPNRKKEPVQYSRGTLFVIDTVRFGGTFALLFSALFAVMNIQSFTAIAYSYIEPLAQVTGIVHARGTNQEVAETLKGLAASNEQTNNNSSQFLPPVGPPEDRLVIPKLHLNVPIVIPPIDALMSEDWKKLEEDIQYALRDGVVHYPGTARPGKPGNFFLTGHSSYFPWDPGKYKSVFARLGELKVGDEYWVFYKGDKHRYVIQEKKQIKPADVSVLDQPIDKRVSTLMTCTPVGTTLFRLILVSQEVDPVTGKALEVGEHAEQQTPKVKMDMLPI